MNMIAVVAHGCPNSWVRQVQHNPQIALGLALTLAQVRKWTKLENIKVPEDLAKLMDDALDMQRRSTLGPPAEHN